VINDLRMLHRDALALADESVSQVRATDLVRPSPCSGWSLGDLLAHMIGQHYGFARAARGQDAPREAYEPVPFEPATWLASVHELRDAFAVADPRSPVVLTELAPEPLPFEQVVAAQLIDTVVHTWDVAQSIGRDFRPPDDLAAAASAIAERIPDRAYGTGRAFARRLPTDGDGWQRTLALVGRRPATTPKE
jgi:uncharacterized protein (TIGR03086 family)